MEEVEGGGGGGRRGGRRRERRRRERRKITVAAAESAIGLAVLVAYYRVRGTIVVRSLNLLRG